MAGTLCKGQRLGTWEGAKETSSDMENHQRGRRTRLGKAQRKPPVKPGAESKGASEAWEGEAKDAGSQVWESTKEARKATWGAMKSGAKAIGDTAGQAWDGAKDIAGKGMESAERTLLIRAFLIVGRLLSVRMAEVCYDSVYETRRVAAPFSCGLSSQSDPPKGTSMSQDQDELRKGSAQAGDDCAHRSGNGVKYSDDMGRSARMRFLILSAKHRARLGTLRKGAVRLLCLSPAKVPRPRQKT